MFFTYSQKRSQQMPQTISQTISQTHNRQQQSIKTPQRNQEPTTPNIFMDNVTKYQMQANMFGRINFGIPCSGCKK